MEHKKRQPEHFEQGPTKLRKTDVSTTSTEQLFTNESKCFAKGIALAIERGVKAAKHEIEVAIEGVEKAFFGQPQPDPSKLPPVNIPPPVAGEEYKDWSRTVKFTPQCVHAPRSTDELQQILSSTKDSVSIVASGHSCSENFANNTVLTLDKLTLDKMPCELKDVSEAGDFSRVEIPANMPLRHILVELAKKGRTLPATGGTDEQQFGGIIATNTAPATKERTIYSGIEEITYTTSAKADNVAKGDDLKAFICNLGVLGVVTSVVTKTIPNEGYRAIQRMRKVDELVDLLAQGKNFVNDEDDDKAEYPFWRFDWLPQEDVSLLWAARKVDTVEDPNYLARGDYVSDYKQQPDMNLYNFIASISSDKPFLKWEISVAFKVMAATIQMNKPSNTFYGSLRAMIPVDRFINEDVNCTMAEWAFHPKQIKKVFALYKKYFQDTQWPNLPIEFEYVKSDDYHMSPWNAESIVVDGEPTKFL